MLQDNDNSAPNRTTALLIFGLAITFVGGFVGLTIAGRDTVGYALFIAGPAVSALVGVVISSKVHGVAQVVRQVEKQTNGMATARDDSLDAHLTAQDITAAQVATTAAELAQNSTQDRPGSTETDRPTDP